MNQDMLSAILWITAGVVFVLFLVRRWKGRSLNR